MTTDYMPVPYVFYEMMEEAKEKQTDSLIHFFAEGVKLDSAKGRILEWKAEEGGEYVFLDSGEKVRLDRIITLFGKPGPAFDEYDGYANACFSCMGGMD